MGGEAGPLGWPCQALLPTPKRLSSEQQLNLPKFIQTQVPTSPWDSCNPNYQARDTGSQGFWGFRQSTQQVALMVAAGTTGLHRSKAPRVLPAATGRGGHGACRVGWPPGVLQRGRLRGEEEGRQAFWQGGPTSLGTLPPSSFCFPSLPASSSHAAPALTQHQTWCRGHDSTLSKQVLSSRSPCPQQRHISGSLSATGFPDAFLDGFMRAALAHTHGLCWNGPDLAHLSAQWVLCLPRLPHPS